MIKINVNFKKISLINRILNLFLKFIILSFINLKIIKIFINFRIYKINQFIILSFINLKIIKIFINFRIYKINQKYKQVYSDTNINKKK
jgi:hypothetical protein